MIKTQNDKHEYGIRVVLRKDYRLSRLVVFAVEWLVNVVPNISSRLASMLKKLLTKFLSHVGFVMRDILRGA